MVKQASLVSFFQSVLEPNAIIAGERATDYSVDSLVPQVVVRPGSIEQVAAVIRLAHEAGTAVIPWGGGTMMRLGNPPARYDIALVLSRLNKIVEHEPADLTATIEAGCSLEALQNRLAAVGQFLPLDPPGGERATIGGLLAANASGPCRHAYGAVRDLAIGMRVVTADGRLAKAGGKVVKNVAGYDLCKLYIGSLGTLGVIVEATFKLWPLPRAQTTAYVPFHDGEEASRYAADLHRRGLALRAIDLLNATAAHRAGFEPRASYLIALWLAGAPAAVDRSLEEARETARSMGTDLSDVEHSDGQWERIRCLAAAEGVELLCKASLLPSRLPSLIAAAESLEEKPSLLARPTIGLAYLGWTAAPNDVGALAHLRDVVANLGGSLVIEACPGHFKADIDVFGPGRSDLELMRRIKHQFDPEGVLNPGRYVGRL